MIARPIRISSLKAVVLLLQSCSRLLCSCPIRFPWEQRLHHLRAMMRVRRWRKLQNSNLKVSTKEPFPGSLGFRSIAKVDLEKRILHTSRDNPCFIADRCEFTEILETDCFYSRHLTIFSIGHLTRALKQSPLQMIRWNSRRLILRCKGQPAFIGSAEVALCSSLLFMKPLRKRFPRRSVHWWSRVFEISAKQRDNNSSKRFEDCVNYTSRNIFHSELLSTTRTDHSIGRIHRRWNIHKRDERLIRAEKTHYYWNGNCLEPWNSFSVCIFHDHIW